MKKVILILSIALVSFTSGIKAQFVVTDPLHIATRLLNSANQIVQTSSTVSNVIKNFNEVKKVYDQGV